MMGPGGLEVEGAGLPAVTKQTTGTAQRPVQCRHHLCPWLAITPTQASMGAVCEALEDVGRHSPCKELQEIENQVLNALTSQSPRSIHLSHSL